MGNCESLTQGTQSSSALFFPTLRKSRSRGVHGVFLLDKSYGSPSSSAETVVEVKTPTIEEAKGIIAEYFRNNDGREIDYVELFEELNFELPIIVAACAELESEKKIG